MSIRVSQYVYNFQMFNAFIIRQAYLHPIVPKRANFRTSLTNSRAEIELCAHLQNPYFFANVPKMPKYKKNKGHK